MICFKCNTHFCYLCTAWLSEDNPYVHFNTAWLPCYQKLWELEEGDGIGVDRANFAYPVEPEPQPEPVQVVAEQLAADPPGADNGQPPPPAPVPPQAGPANPPPARNVPHVNQRVQQGLARPRPVANFADPENGLQRFLRMAANDIEDEWDSDELDSDGEDWEIPIRGR